MSEKKPEKKYWFPARGLGWGWGLPGTWQGWVVFVLYLLAVISASVTTKTEENALSRVAIIIGLSALFIFICWLKGEPIQWKKRDKKQDQ